MLLFTAALLAAPAAALSLGEAAWLADGEALAMAPLSLVLDDGLVFAVEPDGGGAAVGLVFVGAGAARVDFLDRSDAERFANRAVLEGGAAPDEVRAIARAGAPLHAPASAALFIGLDPALATLLASLTPVDAPGETLEDGTILVLDARDLAAARREARRLLGERQRALTRAGLDPTALLELEAWRGLSPGDPGWRGLLEVSIQGPVGPWLTALRDPLGLVDPAYSAQVFTHRALPEHETGGDPAPVVRRVSGRYFPPMDPADPLSPPLPPDRVEPAAVDVSVRARTEDRGWRVGAELSARVEARVIGDPDLVQLRVPRFLTEADQRHAPAQGQAVAEGWAITGLAMADGRPLRWRRVERVGADWEELLVAVPALPPGERAFSLEVHWSDDWPLGRVRTNGSMYASGMNFIQSTHSLGSATGLNAVSPILGTAMQIPEGGVLVRVAVPPDSALEVALSGDTTRRWEDAWGRYCEARTERVFASAALGPWWVHSEPAALGLPEVRVLARTREVARAGFPAEIRRVAHFLRTVLLPEYPLAEVEVFEHAMETRTQLTTGVFGFSRTHATRQGERRIRARQPYWENHVLGQGVANDYWSALGLVHAADRWIARGATELYGALYLRAAFGKPVQEALLKPIRQDHLAGPWRSASLTAGGAERADPDARRDQAHYVLAQMLPAEIGLRAVLVGMDALLDERAGRPTTTAHLQAAMEASAGRELSGFFDFWVHGGYTPELTLSALEATPAEGGTRVTGTLRSSVPFGRLRVPVRVRVRTGYPEYLWLDVVDGEGDLDVVVPGTGRASVTVDPSRQLLARVRD